MEDMEPRCSKSEDIISQNMFERSISDGTCDFVLYPGSNVRDVLLGGDLPAFRRQKVKVMFDNIESMMSMLDYVLSSPKKRHIVGGILLSASLMFAGLAITTMTISEEKDEKGD